MPSWTRWTISMSCWLTRSQKWASWSIAAEDPSAGHGFRMGEEDGFLAGGIGTLGMGDDHEAVVGEDDEGGVREEPDEAPALAIALGEPLDRGQALPAAGLGVPGNGGGAHAGVQSRPLPAVVVLHAGNLHQLRMHPGQVVVLHEVFPDELVVRLDLVVAGTDDLPLLESIAPEPLGEVAELLAEGGRLRIEVEEDEEAPGVDLHGQEAVVRLVETLHPAHVENALHVLGDVRALEERGAQALAVEVVGPAVVGALDALAPQAVGPLREELGGAMAAHVVEGAQLPGLVAADDDGASGHLHHEDLAGLGHLGKAADGHPGPGEDPFPLKGEEFVGGIGLREEGDGVVDGCPGGRVGLLAGVVRGGGVFRVASGAVACAVHGVGNDGRFTIRGR